MVSAKVIGSVIGKSGHRAKALRQQNPECRLNIEGDQCPERVITISGPTKETICGLINDIAHNIWEDFSRAPKHAGPPIVFGRGQRSRNDDEIQICMLLHDRDCAPIIGSGGCRMKNYIQTTGCSVFVWNEYPDGGSHLPQSNEKIASITGPFAKIANCVCTIFEFLEKEGGRSRNVKSWNMIQSGPCWFYGEMEAMNGDSNNGYGNQNNNQFGGGFGGPQGGQNNGFGGNFGGPSMGSNFGGPTFNPNQRFGMIAPCLPGHDPMIQRLEIQEMNNNDGIPMAKIYANIDHVGCIMGHGGMRIKEIRRLSGASITIVDPTGDRCLREITIAPNPKAPNSGMQSIPFAIWLMNVAINAFADVSASLCPFGLETSLQDVVTTGAYGQPDMGQNQDFSCQQQVQQEQPEQVSSFGAAPANIPEQSTTVEKVDENEQQQQEEEEVKNEEVDENEQQEAEPQGLEDVKEESKEE